MFTAFVAALALSAPVPKAAAADLKWKFAKGDTFYVSATMDSTSTVNGGPGVVAQGSTSAGEFMYKATVVSAGEKGTTLEVEFLACKSGNSVAGAAVKMEDNKGTVGKKMTFTLDKDHKVTMTDGMVALGNLGGLLSGEYIKSHVQDLMRAVPGQSLGKGESWKGEEELPLADGIVAKRTDRGTVAGTEDGLTKLDVDTENSMSGGPKGGGVTLKMTGDKGKRTVLFDPKAGRVRKLTEEYAVAGTINIGGGGGAPPGGLGGAPQNITVSMTMKTTISVSDTEPKAK